MDKTSGNTVKYNNSPFHQCVFTASMLKMGPNLARDVTNLTNAPPNETDRKIHGLLKDANGRVSPNPALVSKMTSNFLDIMKACQGMKSPRSCSPVQSS